MSHAPKPKSKPKTPRFTKPVRRGLSVLLDLLDEIDPSGFRWCSLESAIWKGLDRVERDEMSRALHWIDAKKLAPRSPREPAAKPPTDETLPLFVIDPPAPSGDSTDGKESHH